jgi:acetyl esterase/lipase
LTVISVEYRMPPAHLYPVPFNDAWDSLEYTIHHMSVLIPKIQQQSPVKLVLSGTSAGGQLAGILSQRTRDWLKEPANAEINDRVKLAGVLLRAPVTVRGTDPEFIPPRFREMHRSWCEELETPRLDRLDMGENHGMRNP